MGRLVYVVGPSGAGKDSVIGWARARVGHRVVFAHRCITRPTDAGGENHVALTPAEFALRRDAGLFALHWEANGLQYGIDIGIDAALAAGLTVVVNGSRAHLGAARARYPGIVAVLITAAPAAVAARLAARGREDGADVAARLARNTGLARIADADVVIANDGALDDAGAALLAALPR